MKKYAIIYISVDHFKNWINGYPTHVRVLHCEGHFDIKQVQYEPIRMAFAVVIESDALPMVAPGSNLPELEVLYSRS